jgi:hypothetical protein
MKLIAAPYKPRRAIDTVVRTGSARIWPISLCLPLPHLFSISASEASGFLFMHEGGKKQDYIFG